VWCDFYDGRISNVENFMFLIVISVVRVFLQVKGLCISECEVRRYSYKCMVYGDRHGHDTPAWIIFWENDII
jgi:hypothetical protein